MRATIAATIILGIAFNAAAAETVKYKGRSILVGTGPMAEQCLSKLRLAMDLVETLPPNLKRLGTRVTTVKCDPPPMGSTDIHATLIGIYVPTGEAGGYSDFRLSGGLVAPGRYASTLVMHGLFAGFHQRAVEARKSQDAAQRRKADRLEAFLSTANVRALERADACTVLQTNKDAISALELDPAEGYRISKLMFEFDC